MQTDRPADRESCAEFSTNYTTHYYTVSERGGRCMTVLGAGSAQSSELSRTFPRLGTWPVSCDPSSVTGTPDPLIRLQAQMRFLAFTGDSSNTNTSRLSIPADRGGHEYRKAERGLQLIDPGVAGARHIHCSSALSVLLSPT